MALNPQDKRQLAEFITERADLMDRVATLDQFIAILQKKDSAPRTDGSPRSKPSSASVSGGNVTSPLRQGIREVLRVASKPQTSPEITRALMARQLVRDYTTEKPKVDALLKRMRARGDLDKTDDGWELAVLVGTGAP